MGRTVTVDPSVQAHAEVAVQARTGAEVRTLQSLEPVAMLSNSSSVCFWI